jgi:bacterioferritin-associated ferredoxin
MSIIQICPSCGLPGVKVNEKAVMYNAKKSSGAKGDVKLKWHACINPDCECSYFSKDRELTKEDMIKPLFYKDKSRDVPICYCSNLTRGEIKVAVKNGCRTMSEVKKLTKKNTTGHCEKRNPLGKCCRQVFLRTIKEEIG